MHKSCALAALFSGCYQSFSRQNPPFWMSGILFLIFVWLNICLCHSAAVSSSSAHQAIQATLSQPLIFAVPPLCVPSSNFVTVHLVFQPQVPDDSTETTPQVCRVSWWFLLMKRPDGHPNHLLDGDGDNLFPNESQWLTLKEDACMSLSVWGGTLLCVALEAFTLLYEHSLCSSGPPSEKNEPCVSKNWREPVFHFLPPCKSKNFPNNCLLHTPDRKSVV